MVEQRVANDTAGPSGREETLSLRIGTSGWSYASWRGRFYPPELPRREWLGWYARHFSTVELNASFYRLPKRALIERWRESVPEGFLFAVKASRLITHMKRLQEIEAPLEEFLEAVSPLGVHLGPILFQLPPSLGPDLERLEAFLAALPRGRRWAIEFRHPGWFEADLAEALRPLLARSEVAMVGWDMAGVRHAPEPTAPFAYLRFHGPEPHHGGRYGAERLAFWAARIACWRNAGCEVLAYFNNDREGAALDDARTLMAMLNGESASSTQG